MKKTVAISSVILVLTGFYFFMPSKQADELNDLQGAEAIERENSEEPAVRAPRSPASVASTKDESLLTGEEKEHFAQIQSIQEELLITENLPMAEPEEESAPEGEAQ